MATRSTHEAYGTGLEMEVRTDAGVTWRRVHAMQRNPMTSIMGSNRPQHFLNLYEPELEDDEVCHWTVGSDVPYIVKTHSVRSQSLQHLIDIGETRPDHPDAEQGKR